MAATWEQVGFRVETMGSTCSANRYLFSKQVATTADTVRSTCSNEQVSLCVPGRTERQNQHYALVPCGSGWFCLLAGAGKSPIRTTSVGTMRSACFGKQASPHVPECHVDIICTIELFWLHIR